MSYAAAKAIQSALMSCWHDFVPANAVTDVIVQRFVANYFVSFCILRDSVIEFECWEEMLLDIDDLIIRVRQGETDLYEEIVRRHQRDVWRTAAAMLGSVAETEEILQQTFVQAFIKLDQFETGGDFGVWVKQIARNIVRKRFRSDSRESRRLLLYRERLLAELDDPRCLDREEEFLAALAACRESLSERQEQILDLRYRKSLSFAEIAEQLKSSVDAVKRMASRSRLALRECVERKLATT